MIGRRACTGLLLSLLGSGCGGAPGGSGGTTGTQATPETWNGNLTGTTDGPDPLTSGGGAVFAESYTFSLTVPSSLWAALQIPYNQDAEIRSGSGTFSGSETVISQPPGGIYTLHDSSVSDVPLTVDVASIAVDLNNNTTPTIQFSSQAGQTLILNHVTADASGNDYTSPAITIYLYASSVATTSITGTWDAAGQNSARGTFTLTKQ